MLSLAAGTVAFTAPHARVHAPAARAHSVAPIMNEAEVMTTSPTSITENMDGVVVPTGMGSDVVSWYDSGVRLSAEAAAPEVTPAAAAAEPTDMAAPADEPAAAVNMYPPRRKTEKWNPSGIDFSLAPYVGQFAVPDYIKFAPAYLDGTMPGDVGFDPLCLAALAKPNPDILQACLSSEARKERIEAMSAAEQQKGLVWMREAELKHARLAMLAAAGWPLAELVNGSWLRFAGTNGRAPSLFNGALFDFPVGVVVFLALAGVMYSETKTTNLDKVEVCSTQHSTCTPGVSR